MTLNITSYCCIVDFVNMHFDGKLGNKESVCSRTSQKTSIFYIIVPTTFNDKERLRSFIAKDKI